jgi:hypothetical protein
LIEIVPRPPDLSRRLAPEFPMRMAESVQAEIETNGDAAGRPDSCKLIDMPPGKAMRAVDARLDPRLRRQSRPLPQVSPANISCGSSKPLYS